MTAGQVRVAIVGAGVIGRGWGALCVAAGWPVVLFDTAADAQTDASDEVIARARNLVALGRAESAECEAGTASLRVGRSLLQATSEAQWVIESIPEDLMAKQKLFEMLESVAAKARVVSSSSTALNPKDIAARCRRQDRFLVVHPLNPPELIPLVEMVPGPHTDHALMEVLKGWLRALNRMPVVLRKAVPGYVAGRIGAAVWREAIDLVLQGVLDVDDLDRAVSLGPALGWVGAGPHLTYHLAAGSQGLRGFLQHLLQTFEHTWSDLAHWDKLEHDKQQRLIHAIERTYAGQIERIRAARDRRLAAVLRTLELSREG